jgi:hypothetical protein
LHASFDMFHRPHSPRIVKKSKPSQNRGFIRRQGSLRGCPPVAAIVGDFRASASTAVESANTIAIAGSALFTAYLFFPQRAPT